MTLSSYLFVICMDHLSHIIVDQVDAYYLKLVRAGHEGPQVSHLLFAGDRFLFHRPV